MSFEFQFGSKSRLTSRSATYLLLTGALCGLGCVQTQAAPLTASKPAGIGFTMRSEPHVEHRSIWAVRWAAAHPEQEAAYLARLSSDRRAQWHKAPHLKVAALKTVAIVSPGVAKEASEVATSPKPSISMPSKLSSAPVSLIATAIVPKTAPTASAKVAPIKAVSSSVIVAQVKTTSLTQVPKSPIVAAAIVVATPKVLAAPIVAAQTGPVMLPVVSDTVISEAAPPNPSLLATPVVSTPVASPPAREAITRSAAEYGASAKPHSIESDNKAAGNVTLDFVAADINDVIKALAVQTGANIVSSTDVKGSITVSLSHVSLDQALGMISGLSGFQYAKVGSTYVIGTATGLAPFTSGTADQTPAITKVVSFEFASFDDLKNALTDSFPTLKVYDVSPVNGSTNGAPTTTVQTDGTVVSTPGASQDTHICKDVMLIGESKVIDQATDLISQIDSDLGKHVAEQTTVVYNVQYACSNDLITILKPLVPNLVITAGPRQGFTLKASSAGGSASGASSGGSSSGSSSSSGGSSSGSSTSSTTAPNADKLLLTGTSTDIAQAKQILAEVDVQPAQISFETKVTEVDANKVNNLGLNWDFSGATTRIGEEPDNIANPPATLGANGQSNLLSFGAIGRTAVSDLATITMDALIQNGNAKLLADPNISAVDGQAAQVFIGNTVNYVESITQTTTGENITTGSVQVGVILRVTGKVGTDGFITLNIHPEVSEITSYLSVPGGGSLPEVASRYADTTVRVKNGETIAIGGLIQENDTKNINKVPGLGDLPFVGKLFQDSQDNKEKTEVVFLLTTKASN